MVDPPIIRKSTARTLKTQLRAFGSTRFPSNRWGTAVRLGKVGLRGVPIFRRVIPTRRHKLSVNVQW